MMYKKIVFGLLIMFSVSVVAGCGPQAPLMRAPKLPEAQEDIRAALRGLLKPEAKLMALNYGKNTDAIQLVDLTGDGKDEVVVSYTLEEDPEPLRVMVLTRDQKGWQVLDEIKGLGYGIDRIEFCDVTSDGMLDIVVGWQLGGTTKKGVSIFRWSKNKLEEVLTDSYEELVLGDLDGDGKSEVVLLKLNKEELCAKAQVFHGSDQGMRLLDEISTEYVNGYIKTSIGQVTRDKIGLLLDSGVGAHSGMTELLLLENEKLKKVSFGEEDENITFKPYMTSSDDIDGDGILEISTLRPAAGYENASMAETVWITQWYKWDGASGLLLVEEGYGNYQEGYYFRFPGKWGKQIAVDWQEYGANDRWTQFGYFDGNTKHPLFTINTFSWDQWDKIHRVSEDNSLDYYLIAQAPTRVYVVSWEKETHDPGGEAGELQMDLEEIKSNFIVLEE